MLLLLLSALLETIQKTTCATQSKRLEKRRERLPDIRGSISNNSRWRSAAGACTRLNLDDAIFVRLFVSLFLAEKKIKLLFVLSQQNRPNPFYLLLLNNNIYCYVEPFVPTDEIRIYDCGAALALLFLIGRMKFCVSAQLVDASRTDARNQHKTGGRVPRTMDDCCRRHISSGTNASVPRGS